jgi:membrane protein
LRKYIQNKFNNSRTYQTFVRHSKVYRVPGIRHYSLYELWRAYRLQLKRTSLSERAAAISFNIFMAIPPVLIFVFTLVPYLPISTQFIDEIFTLIRDIIPGQKNNSVIISFLEDFLLRPRNELLSSGLLLAVIFSSNAMMGILRSFDKRYEGFRRRTLFEKRITALKLTLIVFTLIFVCIMLLIMQGVVLKWLGITNETLVKVILETRWLVVFFLVFFSVCFTYRHGPAMKLKWPYITPGSIFATSLMILATALVTFWVNHFSNYNTVYGSIGAIFIVMSLIYVNSLVVLIGFELNVTIDALDKARLEPELFDKR